MLANRPNIAAPRTPMPSTLRMVASGSKSVAARSMCPTQSVPIRVDNAYCNGAHSASNSEANYLPEFSPPIVAKNFQLQCPSHPLTPPLGLFQCCESSSHECYRDLFWDCRPGQTCHDLEQQVQSVHIVQHTREVLVRVPKILRSSSGDSGTKSKGSSKEPFATFWTASQ